MADFHQEMDRLQGHMPGWANRHLNRLRQPRAVWVRVPAGIALTGGGVFSVLPVLGLWMVPIGLALLAQDVPPMRKPMARVLRFTNGKIDDMKARKAADKEKARKAYDAMKAYNEAKKARERAAPKGKVAAAGRKHVAAATAMPEQKGPSRP